MPAKKTTAEERRKQKEERDFDMALKLSQLGSPKLTKKEKERKIENEAKDEKHDDQQPSTSGASCSSRRKIEQKPMASNDNCKPSSSEAAPTVKPETPDEDAQEPKQVRFEAGQPPKATMKKEVDYNDYDIETGNSSPVEYDIDYRPYETEGRLKSVLEKYKKKLKEGKPCRGRPPSRSRSQTVRRSTNSSAGPSTSDGTPKQRRGRPPGSGRVQSARRSQSSGIATEEPELMEDTKAPKKKETLKKAQSPKPVNAAQPDRSMSRRGRPPGPNGANGAPKPIKDTEIAPSPPKKRGRPPRSQSVQSSQNSVGSPIPNGADAEHKPMGDTNVPSSPHKKRGRPPNKANDGQTPNPGNAVPAGRSSSRRGRPPKQQEQAIRPADSKNEGERRKPGRPPKDAALKPIEDAKAPPKRPGRPPKSSQCSSSGPGPSGDGNIGGRDKSPTDSKNSTERKKSGRPPKDDAPKPMEDAKAPPKRPGRPPKRRSPSAKTSPAGPGPSADDNIDSPTSRRERPPGSHAISLPPSGPADSGDVTARPDDDGPEKQMDMAGSSDNTVPSRGLGDDVPGQSDARSTPRRAKARRCQSSISSADCAVRSDDGPSISDGTERQMDNAGSSDNMDPSSCLRDDDAVSSNLAPRATPRRATARGSQSSKRSADMADGPDNETSVEIERQMDMTISSGNTNASRCLEDDDTVSSNLAPRATPRQAKTRKSQSSKRSADMAGGPDDAPSSSDDIARQIDMAGLSDNTDPSCSLGDDGTGHSDPSNIPSSSNDIGPTENAGLSDIPATTSPMKKKKKMPTRKCELLRLLDALPTDLQDNTVDELIIEEKRLMEEERKAAKKKKNKKKKKRVKRSTIILDAGEERMAGNEQTFEDSEQPPSLTTPMDSFDIDLPDPLEGGNAPHISAFFHARDSSGNGNLNLEDREAEEEDPEWEAGRARTLRDQELVRQRKAERARREMEKIERREREALDETLRPDLQQASEVPQFEPASPVEEMMEKEATPTSPTDCSSSLSGRLALMGLESSQQDEGEESDGAETLHFDDFEDDEDDEIEQITSNPRRSLVAQATQMLRSIEISERERQQERQHYALIDVHQYEEEEEELVDPGVDHEEVVPYSLSSATSPCFSESPDQEETMEAKDPEEVPVDAETSTASSNSAAPASHQSLAHKSHQEEEMEQEQHNERDADPEEEHHDESDETTSSALFNSTVPTSHQSPAQKANLDNIEMSHREEEMEQEPGVERDADPEEEHNKKLDDTPIDSSNSEFTPASQQSPAHMSRQEEEMEQEQQDDSYEADGEQEDVVKSCLEPSTSDTALIVDPVVPLLSHSNPESPAQHNHLTDIDMDHQEDEMEQKEKNSVPEAELTSSPIITTQTSSDSSLKEATEVMDSAEKEADSQMNLDEDHVDEREEIEEEENTEADLSRLEPPAAPIADPVVPLLSLPESCPTMSESHKPPAQLNNLVDIVMDTQEDEMDQKKKNVPETTPTASDSSVQPVLEEATEVMESAKDVEGTEGESCSVAPELSQVADSLSPTPSTGNPATPELEQNSTLPSQETDETSADKLAAGDMATPVLIDQMEQNEEHGDEKSPEIHSEESLSSPQSPINPPVQASSADDVIDKPIAQIEESSTPTPVLIADPDSQTTTEMNKRQVIVEAVEEDGDSASENNQETPEAISTQDVTSDLDNDEMIRDQVMDEEVKPQSPPAQASSADDVIGKPIVQVEEPSNSETPTTADPTESVFEQDCAHPNQQNGTDVSIDEDQEMDETKLAEPLVLVEAMEEDEDHGNESASENNQETPDDVPTHDEVLDEPEVAENPVVVEPVEQDEEQQMPPTPPQVVSDEIRNKILKEEIKEMRQRRKTGSSRPVGISPENCAPGSGGSPSSSSVMNLQESIHLSAPATLEQPVQAEPVEKMEALENGAKEGGEESNPGVVIEDEAPNPLEDASETPKIPTQVHQQDRDTQPSLETASEKMEDVECGGKGASGSSSSSSVINIEDPIPLSAPVPGSVAELMEVGETKEAECEPEKEVVDQEPVASHSTSPEDEQPILTPIPIQDCELRPMGPAAAEVMIADGEEAGGSSYSNTVEELQDPIHLSETVSLEQPVEEPEEMEAPRTCGEEDPNEEVPDENASHEILQGAAPENLSIPTSAPDQYLPQQPPLTGAEEETDGAEVDAEEEPTEDVVLEEPEAQPQVHPEDAPETPETQPSTTAEAEIMEIEQDCGDEDDCSSFSSSVMNLHETIHLTAAAACCSALQAIVPADEMKNVEADAKIVIQDASETRRVPHEDFAEEMEADKEATGSAEEIGIVKDDKEDEADPEVENQNEAIPHISSEDGSEILPAPTGVSPQDSASQLPVEAAEAEGEMDDDGGETDRSSSSMEGIQTLPHIPEPAPCSPGGEVLAPNQMEVLEADSEDEPNDAVVLEEPEVHPEDSPEDPIPAVEEEDAACQDRHEESSSSSKPVGDLHESSSILAPEPRSLAQEVEQPVEEVEVAEPGGEDKAQQKGNEYGPVEEDLEQNLEAGESDEVVSQLNVEQEAPLQTSSEDASECSATPTQVLHQDHDTQDLIGPVAEKTEDLEASGEVDVACHSSISVKALQESSLAQQGEEPVEEIEEARQEGEPDEEVMAEQEEDGGEKSVEEDLEQNVVAEVGAQLSAEQEGDTETVGVVEEDHVVIVEADDVDVAPENVVAPSPSSPESDLSSAAQQLQVEITRKLEREAQSRSSLENENDPEPSPTMPQDSTASRFSQVLLDIAARKAAEAEGRNAQNGVQVERMMIDNRSPPELEDIEPPSIPESSSTYPTTPSETDDSEEDLFPDPTQRFDEDTPDDVPDTPSPEPPETKERIAKVKKESGHDGHDGHDGPWYQMNARELRSTAGYFLPQRYPQRRTPRDRESWLQLLPKNGYPCWRKNEETDDEGPRAINQEPIEEDSKKPSTPKRQRGNEGRGNNASRRGRGSEDPPYSPGPSHQPELFHEPPSMNLRGRTAGLPRFPAPLPMTDGPSTSGTSNRYPTTSGLSAVRAIKQEHEEIADRDSVNPSRPTNQARSRRRQNEEVGQTPSRKRQRANQQDSEPGCSSAPRNLPPTLNLSLNPTTSGSSSVRAIKQELDEEDQPIQRSRRRQNGEGGQSTSRKRQRVDQQDSEPDVSAAPINHPPTPPAPVPSNHHQIHQQRISSSSAPNRSSVLHHSPAPPQSPVAHLAPASAPSRSAQASLSSVAPILAILQGPYVYQAPAPPRSSRHSASQHQRLRDSAPGGSRAPAAPRNLSATPSASTIPSHHPEPSQQSPSRTVGTRTVGLPNVQPPSSVPHCSPVAPIPAPPQSPVAHLAQVSASPPSSRHSASHHQRPRDSAPGGSRAHAAPRNLPTTPSAPIPSHHPEHSQQSPSANLASRTVGLPNVQAPSSAPHCYPVAPIPAPPQSPFAHLAPVSAPSLSPLAPLEVDHQQHYQQSLSRAHPPSSRHSASLHQRPQDSAPGGSRAHAAPINLPSTPPAPLPSNRHQIHQQPSSRSHPSLQAGPAPAPSPAPFPQLSPAASTAAFPQSPIAQTAPAPPPSSHHSAPHRQLPQNSAPGGSRAHAPSRNLPATPSAPMSSHQHQIHQQPSSRSHRSLQVGPIPSPTPAPFPQLSPAPPIAVLPQSPIAHSAPAPPSSSHHRASLQPGPSHVPVSAPLPQHMPVAQHAPTPGLPHSPVPQRSPAPRRFSQHSDSLQPGPSHVPAHSPRPPTHHAAPQQSPSSNQRSPHPRHFPHAQMAAFPQSPLVQAPSPSPSPQALHYSPHGPYYGQVMSPHPNGSQHPYQAPSPLVGPILAPRTPRPPQSPYAHPNHLRMSPAPIPSPDTGMVQNRIMREEQIAQNAIPPVVNPQERRLSVPEQLELYIIEGQRSQELVTEADNVIANFINGFARSEESPLAEDTSSPESDHNTPPTDSRPQGDQKDQNMSSTATKRRNTNNSRCASLLMASTTPTVTRKSALVDSDDDDDDDEMSSNGESSELAAHRSRTPRGRYSPMLDERNRRTNSRMSALSIDTHRNTDLNADGSAPSSSSAASSAFLTPDVNRPSAPVSHKKRTPHSTGRRKKMRNYPSSAQNSQGETELDSDDEDQRDTDNMSICNDDDTYKVPPNNRKKFQESQETVQGECEFSKSEIAEIFKKGDQQARLPERIQIGTVIMKTWYGSPFPAEFINVRQLYICEFCFFYARSDLIMQNHAKRCRLRAPPGVEIYRKDDVSVFEVDGRRQKSYCQTLCLISRMFLESKTVFYDTEPFFFYVATKNDAHGCHFTGYFSKEKYEPDVNNLSCIMTLPCYQDQGYGRFLIDLSYALSRREKWNGGPEQPLSDLGKKAYGGYWKNTIAVSLVKMKDRIEFGGRGISILDIANDTGINSHDVLSVVCSLGWAKIVDPKNGGKVCTLEWDVDWDVCHAIDEQRRKGGGGKTQFDEKCLDWKPRKMKPHMDGFHELTKEEIEEDEQRRRKSLQKTPTHHQTENMETATPTSSSCPIGSVKKELRSRGHNRTTAGRNLKLELTRKVKVPTEGREITDDDETQRVEEAKSHKKRKSFTRCADDVPDPQKRHEGTPDDDDQPGPSTSKPLGRRPRSTREQVESTASASSEQKTPNGRGRYRRRRGGKGEDSDDEPTEDETVSTDEEAELRTTPRPHLAPEKGKPRGRKPGKKRKSVSGKKFPPNFGVREDKKKTEVVMKTEEEKVEKKQEDAELEKTTAGSEAEEIDLLHDAIDEDMMKNYNIGTPESYHSNSPSPAPPPEMPQPQEPPVEEDPPLLISEVNNLTVAEPVEPMDEGQGPTAPPPLIADTFEDDDDDDDVPPNLSPQYEKNEVHEEEMAPAPPPQHHTTPNQHSHNGMHQEESSYHDPMSVAGPSSIHVTPQMMPGEMSHHYSQPNSHQQTTPGSGGIPSCGGPPTTVPQSTYSTPEQQTQQFMSPQMAGMPASVSSVHSVHNNNSMEMVGGPASLQQHTPQQQYDIMGQMPQEANGMVVNNVSAMEQMMQQHGFNSPPMPMVVPQQQQPQPPQQQVAPQQQQQQPQVVQQQQQQAPPPTIPAPATTNGRRRSESAAATAGARKHRQRSTATPAVAPPPLVPQMPYNPMVMQHMPMAGYPFGYPGYHAYPQMENGGFYPYNGYYGFNAMQQMDPNYQRWHQMTFNPQQMQDGSGAAAAGAVPYQFPPGSGPTMPYFQNNTR